MTRWLALFLAAGCAKPASNVPPPAPIAQGGPSGEAMGWYLRARVAEARGDAAEAERAWGWVDRLDPAGRQAALAADAAPSPERDLARAAELAKDGHPSEAVDVLIGRLDDPDVGADAAAALIPAMYDSCRFATVASWMDGKHAWDREDPWASLALAAARAIGSDREGDVLRAMAERDPAAATEWTIRRGLDAAYAGDTASALEIWRTLPLAESARATSLEVGALVELGRASEATSLARKGLAIFPGDEGLAEGLAAARLKARDRRGADAALAAFEEPERTRRLADAAWTAGDEELALTSLRTAVDGGSALAARQLAAVLDARGDADGALAATRRWTELDPGSADAWAQLAGRDPSVRADALGRALAADPCQPEARILAAEADPSDCVRWAAAWETSPADERLAAGRAACPALPGPLEDE